MPVTVRYLAQLRRAAGVGEETIEMEHPLPLADFLRRLVQSRPETRNLLLDDAGRPHSSLLIFVGEEQMRPDSSLEVKENAVLTLLTPMAGG